MIDEIRLKCIRFSDRYECKQNLVILIGLFIIIQLLQMIPMFYSFFNPIKNALFALVSITTIFLLFAHKIKFDISALILSVFMSWYFIVIVLNYPMNFIDNIKMYSFLFFQLIILFNSSKLMSNTMITIDKVYFAISLIILFVTTLSLIFFMFDYTFEYTLNNYNYVIGTSDGRLTGLFANPNLTATMASLLFLVGRSIFKNRYLFLVSRVVSVFAILLSLSRATLIVFLVCYSFSQVFAKSKKGIIYKLVSISAITISMLSSSFLISSKTILLKIPDVTCSFRSCFSINQELLNSPLPVGNFPKDVDSTEDVITSDRDLSDNLRFELMWIGTQVFLKNPIVGVSSSNVGYYGAEFNNQNLIVENDNPIINNPHNIIIQTLASSGIIGFSILFLMLLNFLGKFFKNMKNSKSNVLVEFYFIPFVFLICISMFEMYILFSTSFIASFFWLNFGVLNEKINNCQATLMRNAEET